jgi:GWxTD domain-containing protein
MNEASGEMVRLGWTLIHFLWQGLAVAAVAGPALWLLRRGDARTRYALACGSLLAMMALPVATWVVLEEPGVAVNVQTLPREGASGYLEAGVAVEERPWEAMMPWVVALWCAGVGVLLLRLAGGWLLAWRRAHHSTEEAPAWVRQRAWCLAERLNLRLPALRTSGRLTAPQVFGWWRPVVLLPVASLTQLTPAQLEMVLAHELAHVLRRDYLVNLLQMAAESLLFYHPAVWWISGRIRAERENCCDDLAVRLCGDTVEYSRALLALEESRPFLNPAATAGDLRARIARILGMEKEETMNATPVWMGLIVLCAGLLMAAPPAAPEAPIAPAAPAAIVAQGNPPAAPSAPAPPKPAKAPAKPAAAPQPAPPPPPPAQAREEWSRLTPDQRAEVKRELEKARKEIEAARGEIERETRQALAEAKRELERERPEIEREIREALAELKSVESAEIAAAVRSSLENALASVQSAQLQKQVVEEALRSSEAALRSSMEALRQAERSLGEAKVAEGERERRVRYADGKWSKDGVKGSETQRGRAYVQYGPPDEIAVLPNKTEKWHYKARAGQAERWVEFDADGRRVKDQAAQ